MLDSPHTVYRLALSAVSVTPDSAPVVVTATGTLELVVVPLPSCPSLL